MNLEHHLTDAQLRRGLFVEEPADDQRQHLALPRRQRRVSLPEYRHLGALKARLPGLRQSGLHGPHQIIIAEWLSEEVDRAVLDGAHSRWDVTVSGDEDNGGMISVGD